MRYLTAVGLLAATSLIVLGQEHKHNGTCCKPDTAKVEQSLIQLEQEWNRALLAKDYNAVDKIMADDWTGVDFRGVTITKAESIEELKAGESENQLVELGEMSVKVFGDTAIVIGSDTEKSTYQGKDSSGRYAWIDVFVNRDGRWQAVASQSTKIAK